jgi:hypothetical protein
MPTATYTPLATVTLASNTSSVTFTGIPATYRDLIFVFAGTATAQSSSRFRMNGITGSNYSFVRAGGNGSTTFSSAPTDTYFPLVWSNSELSTTQSNAIVQIMDYSATDKHKTVLIRETNNNPSGPAVTMYAGRLDTTSAITSLTALVSANNFATGSTFSLYGVIA